MTRRRVSGWLQRRVLRRWEAVLEDARSLPPATLQALRRDASDLRLRLDRVVGAIDARGAEPPAIPAPAGTDWTHRPEAFGAPLCPAAVVAPPSGTAMGEALHLHHDCTVNELVLRQVRNRWGEGLAPYGLAMEAFGFDGSFLSLALALPERATRGLGRHHVIRADVRAEAERGGGVLARLNVRQGPNTAQIVREVDRTREDPSAEFDLAYAELDDGRIEHAWLDLILEEPKMNRIVLRDVTLSRRPRAGL